MLVPIIGMSDHKHLKRFSSDMKAWPGYITLGNLPSGPCNSLTSMAVLLFALSSIPPNYQSPPKQINIRDQAWLTHYRMYSNSSLHLYKIWRVTVYQLTVPMGWFGRDSQSWLRGLRTTWQTLRCMELNPISVLEARCLWSN